MMMRKMMSIVFLLLVLIISLGVSVYMESTKVVSEGMENEMMEEEMPADEMPTEEMPTEEDKPDASGEDSTFDVTPMEGSCTETMSNYN